MQTLIVQILRITQVGYIIMGSICYIYGMELASWSSSTTTSVGILNLTSQYKCNVIYNKKKIQYALDLTYVV